MRKIRNVEILEKLQIKLNGWRGEKLDQPYWELSVFDQGLTPVLVDRNVPVLTFHGESNF